jgi:hypothetical protein
MHEQSPPPYTPLESDLNLDNSYYTPPRQRQRPTGSSLQSIPGSSTTIPPPLPYSASWYTHPSSSHPQSEVRRRNGTRSRSHPTSRFPSPAHSDSESEDGTIYTSQRLRHRSQKENRGQNLYEDEDSSTRTKRPTAAKGKWSWRHWLFALAAGVVGLGDGRDDEREEKVICTTPGENCAGETETETDEPVSPTASCAKRVY